MKEDASLELGPVLQKRLLTPFLLKKVPHVPEHHQRESIPRYRNPFQWLFFTWLFPVMFRGYKRTLEPNDLPKLNDDIRCETMGRRVQNHFDRRLQADKKKHIDAKMKERGETTSSVSEDADLADYAVLKSLMMKTIFQAYAFQFTLGCFLAAIGLAIQTTTPLLSKQLIKFVQEKALGLNSSVGQGVGYAVGVAAMVLVADIITNQGIYLVMKTGSEVKGVLLKLMLDKSFRLNARARKRFPPSKITSIMGTDLARIDLGIGFSVWMFTCPVPVAISIGILVHNVRAPAMVGVGLMLCFVVIAGGLGALLFGFRKEANILTDQRVGYMKEVLSNLKMIKFYSWEVPYFKIIEVVRRREMGFLLKMEVTRSIIISVASSLSTVSAMAAFLVLYAVADAAHRNPATIFSSVALFNMLAGQFVVIPLSVSGGTDAFIGMMRVGEYLSAPEGRPDEANRTVSEEEMEQMEKAGLALSVEQASFEWEAFEEEEEPEKKEKEKEKKKEKKNKKNKKEENEKNEKEDNVEEPNTEKPTWTLKDVSLHVAKGEFIVITGLIGAGKTSLLHAIDGVMKCTAGKVVVNGQLVMCGTPWIQNSTVRNNITFGAEYNDSAYQEVIYACSLESDLAILPAGDNTEIGERGITLSGGQKARISLARAVYADSEIVLLDDVLSAVDAKVGRHIMDKCILGLLKNRTRILATHQLSLIGSADRVVFLNSDGSVSIGTLDELRESNAAFSELMALGFSGKDEDEDDEEDDEEHDEKRLIIEQIEDEKRLIERQVSRQVSTQISSRNISSQKSGQASKVDDETRFYSPDDGKLISEEFKSVNAIGLDVYKTYIGTGAGAFKFGWILPTTLLGTVLCVFFNLFTNVWLSFWIEHKFAGRRDGFYIGLYVLWSMLAVVTMTLQFAGVVVIMNVAAKILNLKAAQRILYVPMAYMDVTPMGRILNRFTKDTDTLDNEMGDKAAMIVYFFASICGVLILCVIYLPWFAVAVPFLVFIFAAYANFYQASGREVKRVEAVQRSHVYNNFNETLTGMATIQSYGKSSDFLGKNVTLIDSMNEAYFVTVANQRWLDVYLSFIASAFALLISLLCVFRVFKISPASVGLLLSYVLQISSMVSMMVVVFTQVEQDMNSAERILEYVHDLPQEGHYIVSETAPAPSWPEKGEIRFENASLSYRPGLPLVLKNFNADVRPNEKIGICGRTGAGKSSVMVALYRIVELLGGKIEIDGIDISTLGLNNLRSKLSIIPQDPVLFKGTIRKNLDPFALRTDDELWETLRRAGIIDASEIDQVKAQTGELHKFHLDRDVEDDGDNFSLGEKQLIAFARALVRGSKVLILDEATSSVDYATDNKIQSAIVREFSECTILCIAHRLKTILNYDRVMVMDKGEIKEFDTPWNLFNSAGSVFRQMCDKSDIQALEFTRL